jgi:hypothetical protein
MCVCVCVRSESETIKRILNQLQLQQIDARRFEDECRHYKFQNTALQSEVCLLTEDKEKLEYELAQAQESILLLKVIIIARICMCECVHVCVCVCVFINACICVCVCSIRCNRCPHLNALDPPCQ